MTIQVVYLLELIEVDVNQPEDACILARLVNLLIQTLLKGEAVVYAGELVELRATEQIGIQPAGLDGQGGQPRRHGEGLGLDDAGFGERIERGKDGAERASGAGWDLVLDDAQGSELWRAISQLRPIGDLNPAGSTLPLEGNQFCDLFDDLSKWT